MKLNAADGPYIFLENDGSYRAVTVVDHNETFQLQEEHYEPKPGDHFTCHSQNKDLLPFQFRLRDQHIPAPSAYDTAPPRTIVLSDIEGNFTGMVSFLTANGVINEEYQWTYGDGHLVMLGDLMDRSDDVTALLWLLYKLEDEAIKAGGSVHTLLGNHETMNFDKDIRYWHQKYVDIAKIMSGKSDPWEASSAILNKNNLQLQWLSTKNALIRIGTTLFVHGGISPQLLAISTGITEINARVHKFLSRLPSDWKTSDEMDRLIMNRYGPFWYRGIVEDYREHYEKVSESFIDKVLDHFGVDRMVIGHTMVEDVSTDFNGKVIRCDVEHGTSLGSGDTRGLLIEGDKLFKVNDKGDQALLLP